MADITTGTVNITTQPNPPAGNYIIGVDIDGVYKKKNPDGAIIDLEGGTTPDPSTSIVREVYLVVDSPDQTRMGGPSNNVYTTFQDAYDAADALSIAIGNQVVSIRVGQMSGISPGDVTLNAPWNPNVFLEGLGREVSQLGNIITSGYDVILEANNVYIAGIITNSGSTDGGNISLELIDCYIGDNGIDTRSLAAVGNAGSFSIGFLGQQSSNVVISGPINTEAAINGNGGSIGILSSGGQIQIHGIISTQGANAGNGGNVQLIGGVVVFGSVNTSGGPSGGKTGDVEIVFSYIGGTITQTEYGTGGAIFRAAQLSNFSTLEQINNSSNAFGPITIQRTTVGQFDIGLGGPGTPFDGTITRGNAANGGGSGSGEFGGYTLAAVDIIDGLNPPYVAPPSFTLASSQIDLAISEVPAMAVLKQLFLITSVAGGNITEIFNMPPNWTIKFQPVGIPIKFVNGSSSTELHLDGAMDRILNGSNGDWIEFTNINGVIVQTNIQIYTSTTINAAGSPYSVEGHEEILLLDSTSGPITVNLLPANNTLSKRRLTIKDYSGQVGSNDIIIHPDGADTIDTSNSDYSLDSNVGAFGSVDIISNGISYSILK